MVSDEEALARAMRRAKNQEESRQAALLREEQAAEYEESLRIDQEREHTAALKRKQEEEAARVSAEQEEERRKKAEIEVSIARQEEEDRQRRVQEHILKAKSQLLPEPAKDASGRVDVMVRTPGGRRLRRGFLASTPVAQIYHFLDAEGGDEALAGRSYRLVSSRPRTIYDNRSASLADVGLSGQCVLLVEKTDDD